MARGIDPDEAAAYMRTRFFEPLTPYPGANQPWRCRCMRCGSEVTPRYSTAVRGVGCRVCAGQVVDLEKAAAVMRERGLEPIVPYPGAAKKWACRCLRCGADVNPTYHAVASNNSSGCARCGRERSAAARRIDPEAAAALMRENGYEPMAAYPGSGVPWPCHCVRCGHESKPTYNNVKQGYGCKQCGRERTAAASALDPEETAKVMRERGFRPLVAYPGSNEPWRCLCLSCEREVSPTYASVRNGGGCRYCVGQTVDPEDAVRVMREANLTPLVEYPGAGVPWLSECAVCGQETSPRYSDVRRSGHGCRHCGIRRRADSHRLDPVQAARLMRERGFVPLEDYPGAGLPWRSRCVTCGKEVEPTYSNVRGGYGCRYCGYERIAEARRLDVEAVTAFMREHDLEPVAPYPGAGQPWQCECRTCGRRVQPRYNCIKQGQGGCGYCAGKAVDPDEAARYMRDQGLEPLVDYPGSNARWLCRCTRCEREVHVAYGRIRRGAGCPKCAEDRRGETLRLDPKVVADYMRSRGLEPLVDYPGSNARWLCRCTTCEREVTPSYSSVRGGRGCRHCAVEVYAATRRHSNDLAAAFMRAAGFEPQEEYTNALTKWHCICLGCKKDVYPTYNKVQNGAGCRYCKKSGFDYGRRSLVYVMTHAEFRAVKVGIANIGARLDRVRSHRAKGWRLFKSVECETGELAWLIERATLVLLHQRTGHNRGFLSREEMPQFGWTETFPLDEINEHEAWSLVLAEAARIATAR